MTLLRGERQIARKIDGKWSRISICRELSHKFVKMSLFHGNFLIQHLYQAAFVAASGFIIVMRMWQIASLRYSSFGGYTLTRKVGHCVLPHY